MIAFPRGARVGLVVTVATLAGLTGLEGCANVSPPPGGPADTIPPALLSIRPDSGAVVPGFRDRVVFEFDEAISERDIQASVTLFPLERRPDLDKAKRELKVKPRAGWVENRIYHIIVNPVVQDLFNNRIPQAIPFVFSTGLPIPANRTQGIVNDRITGQALREGRVDMVLMPDTLRYGTAIDSAGTFRLSALPPGDYLAIGYEDLNSNSRADDFDRSDTARVSLGPADTLTLEFKVFRHDTAGPVLTEVQPLDSVTLELRFDGYLDPEARLDTSLVELLSLADSTPVPVDTVLHDWAYDTWRDSLAAIRAAAQDTAVRDTLQPPGAAEPDTAPPAPAPLGARAPAQQARDTATAAQPLPARQIFVIAATPIPPGAVRVRVRQIVNLTGLMGASDLEYEQPPREPPETEEGGDPGGADG